MTLQVTAGAEWINDFHADACEQNDLSYRDDHAQGFLNEMRGHGHIVKFDWGNDNAWETDFRHPDYGGDSLNWTDDVNFLFYSDHGGNWGSVMHLAFSKAHGTCLASSNQWRLGRKALKWIVLDCCQAVLNTTVAHVVAVWAGPMQGAHMVFGFIGNGHDSWWNGDLGEDFGHDAATGARLANAWLDRGYSFWLDDNPIAIAAGTSQADAVNRRENESVNWRDASIASTNWLAWKYRE